MLLIYQWKQECLRVYVLDTITWLHKEMLFLRRSNGGMYIKFGDPKQWRSKMDLHSGDPWISIQGIHGSPFRGSVDLQSEDPRIYSKEILIKRTCSGFCLFGSSLRCSMDLQTGDPWIYSKEI